MCALVKWNFEFVRKMCAPCVFLWICSVCLEENPLEMCAGVMFGLVLHDMLVQAVYGI